MDLDVDQFLKDMESAYKHSKDEGTAGAANFEEGSSTDMDFGKFVS